MDDLRRGFIPASTTTTPVSGFIRLPAPAATANEFLWCVQQFAPIRDAYGSKIAKHYQELLDATIAQAPPEVRVELDRLLEVHGG